MAKGVLILTQSGGSGHRQMAKQISIYAKEQGHFVVVKDTLMDFLGKFLGKISIIPWNTAQKYGNVYIQNMMMSNISFTNPFFYPIFYFQVLKNLRHMKAIPFKVVITEITGLKPILAAVAQFNKEQREKDSGWQDVIVENWFPNFPTQLATYYLPSIRDVPKKYRSLLLHVLTCNRKEDVEHFCQFTGFPESQVRVLADSELPVLDDFKDSQLKNVGDVHLGFKLSDTERTLIKNLPHLSLVENKYLIPEGDLVYLWMMGSQPTFTTTQEFVQSIIKLSQQATMQKHLHVLVLCGEKEALFRKICQVVQETASFPAKLTILPLPAQGSAFAAAAMARSNKRFTRAGGSTSQEHLYLQQSLGERSGKVFIVGTDRLKIDQTFLDSATKSKIILQSLPIHERANALYLIEKLGAEVVNMDTLAEKISPDLS